MKSLEKAYYDTRFENDFLKAKGNAFQTFFNDLMARAYKSESLSGELSNIKCDGVAPCLTSRHLFTIEFEDGTRRELYQSFVIDGKEVPDDLDFLFKEGFNEAESFEPVFFTDQLKMFIQNQEAKIRSNYDGVTNIRHKCVGIQTIN